ncbi:Polyneuridine-aldehyde esterase precursor, putative [Ricinus communis]|uniref:Polyneuridine-aldehyde esterase, putative n=1 Tax=Ricinus communis TaxID=3988 RepID=B9S8N1_RICCO|nr:Polyneuridine-aldehyde esterase precursor, putative [Ricinus communis]
MVDKVATLLKSAGHRVTALDLAASGVNRKQVHQVKSISEYFEPLMEFMMSLPLEERVILVAHSYGGLGISFAMERFPDKISAAVFATATIPGPDMTYTTIREELYRRIDFMDSQFTFDYGPNNPPSSRLFGPNCLSSSLYQLSQTEDLMLAMMLIRPFPLFSNASIQIESVLTKEKYGSVPRIYI